MNNSQSIHVVVLHERTAAEQLQDELAARLPSDGVTITTTDPDPAVPAEIQPADVLVTFNPPSGLLDTAEGVQWIHALTAGVDGYDTDQLHEREIVLTNASGVHAQPIAEQVLGYSLVFERRIHRGIRQQERSNWQWYGGREFSDRTVGVVGVGAIGARVAELASAVGASVIGTKRNPDSAPSVVEEVFSPESLHTMIKQADYVVVACPLTPATRRLFGTAEFMTMNEHAVLINVARGPIVDETALVEAIQEGEILGAALDVFEEEPLPGSSPLWDLDDVIITPHMAGSTPHYWERNADLIARNYPHFLGGRFEKFVNRVV